MQFWETMLWLASGDSASGARSLPYVDTPWPAPGAGRPADFDSCSVKFFANLPMAPCVACIPQDCDRSNSNHLILIK